jgi:RimJ/RimL family protein N-acetyltransferase
MMRFHRFARSINNDDVLMRVLLSESNATLLTSTALHWTIMDGLGQSIGFISLVDYSADNKRAELVVGLPQPRYGLALEACLLLLDFAFGVLKLNKLCSVIYDKNAMAIKSTRHLGFVLEGVQRQHIYDAVDRQFLDIINSSLLATEYLTNPTLNNFRRKFSFPFSGN